MTRALALTALGSARFAAGDLTGAAAALDEGLAAAERGGLLCAELRCSGKRALLYAVQGQLHRAERSARGALALPPCAGRCRVTGSAYAYLALAVVRYQTDRLDESERYLDLVDGGGYRPDEPVLTAGLAALRAGVRRARGELAAGYEALVAARGHLGANPSRFLQDWLLAVEADLRIRYGDTDTARDLLNPLLADRQRAPAIVAVALARAHLAGGDPGAAARVLPVWTEDAEDRPDLTLPVRLEAGLLAAVAARMSGDDHRAATMLERVLQLAEPEGFRLLFTRGGPLVRDLLLAQLDTGTAYWSTVSEALKVSAPEPPAGNGLPAAGLTEPLSDRELTILRYLQGALSNLEIAADLCLSVNTVKTHVRSIYRKLHAGHRREAVHKARQLKLL